MIDRARREVDGFQAGDRMVALTVDVSYLWTIWADLQRTADAAPLAAAAMLAEVNDPANRAREAAGEYLARNEVMNESAPFEISGVTLGRAALIDGRYRFVEVADDGFPDTVRVRVETTRCLYFARSWIRGKEVRGGGDGCLGPA